MKQKESTTHQPKINLSTQEVSTASRWLTILLFSIILSVSMQSVAAQTKVLKTSMERGSVLYKASCTGCHGATGEGIAGVFPPLAKADYVANTIKTIKAVKFGVEGPIKVNNVEYNNMMPPANLTDQEVADVVNYIKNMWGNTSKGKVVTAKTVGALKP